MADAQSLESLEASIRQVHKQFEEIADAHRPALWRYCHRLTGSAWDAEDLVQETLARAFARLAQFWQPLDARSYLFRIATNTWIDSLRRARVQTTDLDAAAPELADPGTGVTDPGETWGAMELLVQLLPPRQRAILLLTQVFDFTAGEVGAMIGLTEGAVKAALHRARATLKARGAGEPDANATQPAAAHHQQLVARYIDAFNRRDLDALLALLDAEVTGDIVGAGQEYGLEVVRKYSLSEWAADPQPMWAEPGTLEDRPVVYVYYRTEQHDRALAWIITLDLSDDRITTIRTYCFTPDLIQHAADQLGVPAVLMGYRYVAPAN